MLITHFCKSLQAIETVSVLDSESDSKTFSVTFRVEEIEEGWLALEALARISTKHRIRLTSEANESHQSLFFRLTGNSRQFNDMIADLDELSELQIEENAV